MSYEVLICQLIMNEDKMTLIQKNM